MGLTSLSSQSAEGCKCFAERTHLAANAQSSIVHGPALTAAEAAFADTASPCRRTDCHLTRGSGLQAAEQDAGVPPAHDDCCDGQAVCSGAFASSVVQRNARRQISPTGRGVFTSVTDAACHAIVGPETLQEC